MRAVDLKAFLPVAPLWLRPVLDHLLRWMARTDERLAKIEAHLSRKDAS